MMITEQTTLGELREERTKLGIEYLALNDNGRTHTRTCILIAGVPEGGMTTIYGHGATEAESINDAFAVLRKRRGMPREDPNASSTSG